MANADDITKSNPASPRPKWPNEPEGMLNLLPEDMEGSPVDMLTCALMRAHGIVSVLLAEFMGTGGCRPDDSSIMAALWATQGNLHLAQGLLERLEDLEGM